MKIDTLQVKLRFCDSKVREIQRPDVDLQAEIIKHINDAMYEYGAHIVDLELKAGKE